MNVEPDDNEKIYKEILKSYDVPATKSKDQMWEAINAKIENVEVKETQTKVIPMWRWAGAAVAASVAILLAFVLTNVSVETPNGKTMAVTLPDGSKAQLHAGSTLSYNSILWNFNRNLNQEGEVFYKVQKGEKFQVITGLGTVSVLGTSFNVLARKDIFMVACASGKVEVASALNDSKVELTPGESVQAIKNQQLSKAPVALDAIGTWRTGQLQFEDAPLEFVFGEIERNFSLSIDHEALDMDRRFFTGSFSNQSLNDALEIVCGTTNLSFTVLEGGNVVIR